MLRLRDPSPRRRSLIVTMIGVVVVAFAALAVRAMSASTGPASTDQARPGAVILVPGYGGSQAALSVLADRLRASGRAATVLTLPGDGTGDLVRRPMLWMRR